jgi:hypothetical protein
MNHAFKHKCTIQTRARKQKLLYDGGTVAPVAGQTIEGGSTGAHGLIEELILSSGTWVGHDAAGYMVLSYVEGVFIDNEMLSTPEGGAAIANGANTDYKNLEGEYDYYWVDDATETRCKLFWKTLYARVLDTGEAPSKTLILWLPGSKPVRVHENRVATTETAMEGQYDLSTAIPIGGQARAPHHFECTLEVIG